MPMAENGSRLKIGSYAVWLAVKGLLAAASLLPQAFLLGFFRAASASFHALGIRRRVVRVNLRAAFGKDLPEPELDRITRGCYAEYGRILAEILHSDRLLREKEDRFDLRGLPILEEARRNGTGLLILTGHLGNFIVLAHLLGSMGFRMTGVAKRIANPYLNREVEAVYGRYGSTIIEVRGARNDPQGGIRLYRSLKQGNTVVAMVDQDAGPEGYISTFFGLPTSLPSGPVRLAFRSGAKVTTGFATREDGRIRMEVQPHIDCSRADSPDAAERIVLDEYSRRMEAVVRRVPEQYFWFHKKWKSVPEIRARYEGAG
ncbi:MAG: htrB [Deltaproteobacteria bacterium]|nr:htrB [Deltaproteobacteria bacterium]